MGAERADLQRLDGELEIVEGRRGAGEVKHPVERAVDPDVLRDVVLDQGETAPRRQAGQIVARPGHEVVHGDDVPAPVEEVLTEVRADEPRPARDQDPHRATYERRKGLRPIE